MPRLPIERSTACTVTLNGQELLAFQGCDYLGLAHHPEVIEAARAALGGGLSCGASRETTGNRPVYERLEEALAEFLGTEAALLTSSGALANLVLFQGLAEPGWTCVADADAHPSLLDAARATELPIRDHGPGDLLRAHALVDRFGDDGVLLATDGVYLLQGRLAQVQDLLQLLPDHGALIVDDSHGLGVLAPGGGGSLEYWSVSDARVTLTASLAKAVGVTGGVIAGSASTIARVRGRSEAYIGSTPPPPPMAAAALTALDILQRDGRRRERLRANSVALQRIGKRLGIEPKDPAPSVPALPVLALPVADEADGLSLQLGLRAAGIFAAHVHYPGAPEAGVLRLAVNAEHGAADLHRLEQALAPLYPEQDSP